MAAGINNGTIVLYTTGGYGTFYANWAIIVRDLYPKSRWFGSSTIFVDLELWAEVDGQVFQIEFPAPTWSLFKVT
jgi:hypothetical protein